MVSTHQALEGIFAQLSIRTGHIQKVVAFANGCFIAVAVGDFWELHIRTYEGAEGGSTCSGSKTAFGKQFFHFGRQDVVSKAHQVFNIIFVVGKSRLGLEHLCQFFFIKG